MKVYRTRKKGIAVWRISGTVAGGDAGRLMRSIDDLMMDNRRCLILDFENVVHVDYRIFTEIEDLFPNGATVLLSGLSDYVLDIFAFVTRKREITVYPDWKKAFHCLMAHRGRIGTPPVIAAVG
jgi:hypothetical protein